MRLDKTMIRLHTKSNEELSLNIQSISAEVTDIKIELNFKIKTVPQMIKIKWNTKAAGSCMVWSPTEVYVHELKPNWNKSETESRSAKGMPIQCYISAGGENVVMVAVMDVQTPMIIRSGIVEETGELEWELQLFSARTEELQRYDTIVRIDERRIPYEKMIRETVALWQTGYTASADLTAFSPVYSTWYSYHQELSMELINELKAAAELGMKTVIIDDGWQTDDSSRGYAYCGDWRVAKNKISDIKAFVDEVHALGMKIMLWYSVPFVGVRSELWEHFKDKILYKTNGEFGVLDPRYPQVREFLVSAYEQAVSKWGIDGLKLDFIDSFELREESCISHMDMDILSVEKAMCALLEEVYASLTALRPDILIEFRQNYVGPVMLKYGNMLRAADCPMDAVTNRIRTINLRLTSGNAAVHSDMLMWDYEAETEIAAEQFINIMFSVPQISVRISELSDEHYAMLRFFLALWIHNQKIITEGNIHAFHPEANYTLVYAEKDDCIVAVAYSDKLLHLENQVSYVVLVNGTGTIGLYLETESTEYSVDIYDCMGGLIGSGIAEQAITKIDVPVSGVAVIKRRL